MRPFDEKGDRMDNSGGFTAPPPPPPPPPPGGGGGAGAGGSLPARQLGGILTAAWQIYTKNAMALILIVAIVVVPLTFVGALLTKVVLAPNKSTVELLGQRVEIVEPQGAGIALLVAGIGLAIGIIITAVLQAAMLRGAAQASLGDTVDIEASYRWGLKRFPSVLLVALLVGLVVLIGFILLIVPGFIFWVMLSVAIPALVIENRRGTDAMSRSWNLVKGHFWHAFGTIFVALLIAGLVGSILTAIGGDNWFTSWILSSIAQILVAPFTALVSVLLYLDLRARSEALTAEQLRAELAANA
jgi:hypothetical protein